MTALERDLAVFHAVFLVAAAAALLLRGDVPHGVVLTDAGSGLGAGRCDDHRRGGAVILLPELLLGWMVHAGSRWVRRSSGATLVVVAALVALAYTGAAAVSWLVFERWVVS